MYQYSHTCQFLHGVFWLCLSFLVIGLVARQHECLNSQMQKYLLTLLQGSQTIIQAPSKKYEEGGQSFLSKHSTPDKPKVIDAAHLFRLPHRMNRPDHIVIILRGLPGSFFCFEFWMDALLLPMTILEFNVVIVIGELEAFVESWRLYILWQLYGAAL